MTKHAALVVCSVGLLFGCQPSEEEMAKGVSVRTNPAGVRVINHSNSAINVRISDLTKYVIEPGGITPGILVPANKTAKVELGSEGKIIPVAVQESKFSTVVVDSTGHTVSFVSGSPISVPGKALLEFVNPSNEPVEFTTSNETEPIKVGPKNSVAKEVDPGTTSVNCYGDTLELKYGASEIVAIYPFKENGKAKLRQRSLKGTGAPIATGGPSAN